MLALQVAPPLHGELELLLRLENVVDSLRVGDPGEVGGGDAAKALAEVILRDVLLEKLQVLVAVLQHVRQAVLEVRLGAVHVVLKVRERELGLDHPELGEVAAGVGVLSPERRPERVDVPHGARVNLGVELAGNGQVGGFAEEVLAVVHGAGGVAGDVAARRRR